jgi:hypothetical protein
MKFTREPTIKPGPNAYAPLSAIVEFGTDGPGHAILDLSDGERQWSIKFDKDLKTEHTCLVLGLRPGKTHRILVKAINSTGRYRSPPLPCPTIFRPSRLPAASLKKGNRG